MPTRDKTRIHDAFCLLADEDKTGPYSIAVKQAHALGGKELTAILALAVGRSEIRNTKKGLKQKLPAILAEKGWHRSTQIRKYVRSFEGRLTPELTTNSLLNEPSGSISNPNFSQQKSSFSTPQSQYQTELTGSVYELTPTDLLELSTGLITQKNRCSGPLLLTEPFNPATQPFITIPITTELCLQLRGQLRQVM